MSQEMIAAAAEAEAELKAVAEAQAKVRVHGVLLAPLSLSADLQVSTAE